MKTWPQNEFGPVLWTHDPAALAAALGIEAHHRVLEVGGAANPFPRANVVCDLTFGESAQRNGAPGTFREGVSYVEARAEALPFPDGAFDFVWCTQVLEHVEDPALAARELSRVARRGFIEVPSRLGEMANGNPTHRWIVDREGDTLVFHPRTFVEHPLHNFFYGVHFRVPAVGAAAEGPYRNLFNHQVCFGPSGLSVRVMPAERGVPFDYGDPVLAARAHYSFARNCALGLTEPHYSLPDAQLAVRYAPESEAARLLLAVHEARLLRFEDAQKTLAPFRDRPRSRRLWDLIARLARGEAEDPKSLPLPEETRLDAAAVAFHAPIVAILCAGALEADLLAAAESALVQDHPGVQVVVAGPLDPARPAWRRLSMGARLHLLPRPAEEGLAGWLNAAALAAAGAEWFGFCLAGDRLMAHHVARLLAQAEVGGGSALLGDLLHEPTATLLPGEFEPGNPMSARLRLSALLVRREAALEVGLLESLEEDRIAGVWLTKLALKAPIQPLRELTVRSKAPLPTGAAVRAIAEAGMRLNAAELIRDLIGSIARERGLEERVAALEAELRELQA